MRRFRVRTDVPPVPSRSDFFKPTERLRTPAVPVRPRKLNLRPVNTGEGRLLRLRAIVNALFKLERIELPRYQADEARHYAERLIQIAIEYGDRHRATMEMADYWLEDKELIHKLFRVLVPRFEECYSAVPFTRMFRLPAEYQPVRHERMVGWWDDGKPGGEQWRLWDMAVLELRGNPYPPVIPRPETHRASILNVLLDSARRKFRQEHRAHGEPVTAKREETDAATSSPNG